MVSMSRQTPELGFEPGATVALVHRRGLGRVGFLVSVEEPASLRFGNGLAFDESQLVGSMLDGVTIHVGGLVREVEDEPQFEAGVRDGGPDARVAGFGYGALEVGMGIDVEHAPDLVELGVPARL